MALPIPTQKPPMPPETAPSSSLAAKIAINFFISSLVYNSYLQINIQAIQPLCYPRSNWLHVPVVAGRHA